MTPPHLISAATRLRPVLTAGLLLAALPLTALRSPAADVPGTQTQPPAATAPATPPPPTPPPTPGSSSNAPLPDASGTPPTPVPPTTEGNSPDRIDRQDRSDRSDRSDASPRRPSRRRDRADSNPTPESQSSTNSGGSGTDFASFKVIGDRNIFNPNRGRGSGRNDREAARKPTQIDLVTLVGALTYAKGDFAFFDGSSAQFRKTLKSGDTIAGYTIRSIQPNTLHLEAGDKSLDMPVGSQFRREDEGEWTFVPRANASAASPNSSSSSSSGTPGADAPSSGSPGGADDILQRLMRKREQEK